MWKLVRESIHKPSRPELGWSLWSIPQTPRPFSLPAFCRQARPGPPKTVPRPVPAQKGPSSARIPTVPQRPTASTMLMAAVTAPKSVRAIPGPGVVVEAGVVKKVRERGRGREGTRCCVRRAWNSEVSLPGWVSSQCSSPTLTESWRLPSSSLSAQNTGTLHKCWLNEGQNWAGGSAVDLSSSIFFF